MVPLPFGFTAARSVALVGASVGSSVALARDGATYQAILGAQLALLVAAVVRSGIARYYVLVTWATVVALWNYVRHGVPATWEAPEGTRDYA